MEPLVRAAEMRHLDRLTIERLKIPGYELMCRAGAAVSKAAREMLVGEELVCVVCGCGNNGGDGLVAARLLWDHGCRVICFVLGSRARLKGDAKKALEDLESVEARAVHFITDASASELFLKSLQESGLLLDALLGTGIRSRVRSEMETAIELLNRAQTPVLAVDMPSGIDSDTGQVMGVAVQAQRTLTFAFKKVGQALYPGAEYCGEVVRTDIGIPTSLHASEGYSNFRIGAGDGPALLPRREAMSHKGTFGHVLVLAGSPGKPGAARLVLEGALRSGAGLVSWATDEATLGRAGNIPPEVMLCGLGTTGLDEWSHEILHGINSVVLGPGYATDPLGLERMQTLLERARVPICVDAEGLNLLSLEPSLWEKIEAPMVLTPHPKEMSRLMGGDVAKIQADRVAAAQTLSRGRGVVVLLKGAGSVVASPENKVHIIGEGTPALASGGTGDVLAGMIGGRLAQGLLPTEATVAGALWHACAGKEASRTHGVAGVVASDVALAMGTVLKSWNR